MKGKDLQPTLLHPAKLSFRVQGQIKCFPDKVKLKEFIITKPLLHVMLKVKSYLFKKKIKTMNIKMATNEQLSTTESREREKKKTKLGKPARQDQNHRNGDHVEGNQLGGGKAENRRKGAGTKKHKWCLQNRQGDFENSEGNGEAKELICMTCGHELRGVNCWRELGYQVEVGKGG